MAHTPITLLTDFGTADYYVGAMKGVILAGSPGAPLVDITHDIPPQDLLAGAFTLLAAYRSFPPGTIHLAVVDPGVGSERRPIVVDTGAHRFVGPDNGLFGYLLDREPDARVFHLTDRRLFRPEVSPTFHGRDLFAPVVAALHRGQPPDTMGPEIHDPIRLPPLRPRPGADGALLGAVIHVDRFGSCVTSFTREDLPPGLDGPPLRLEVGEHAVTALHRFFAEATHGEAFALWGSAGFLEIALRDDSAAARLGIARGAAVRWVLPAARAG